MRILLLCCVLLATGLHLIRNRGPIAGHKALADKSVFVAPVSDATDIDGDVVAGSGEATVAAFQEALRKRGISVVASHGAYTLTVTLTHWEHHATEWNFMPDVVGLSAKLTSKDEGLISIATGRLSGSAIQFSHEMPDRLLPDLANDAILRLYHQ